MHSPLAFLAVAILVTLTPGPAFALLIQVAARHGRRAAFANIAGNSIGVLFWGLMSAVGVSALIAANQLAFDALRLVGAVFLIAMGVRSLRGSDPAVTLDATPAGGSSAGSAARAVRKGMINSLANPKLAVFFIALFPQFLSRSSAVLPAAVAMAGVIVLCDIVVYGTVATLVDRFRQAVGPRLLRRLERVSGVVLVAFGVRLATEAR